jgi:hypothetical protein
MIDPAHIRRFEGALRSEKPADALYQLALALREEGVSQLDLYLLFERFQILSPEGENDDAITDTMDLIGGGPWAKGHGLFAEEITTARLTEYTGKTTGERIKEIEANAKNA